MIDETKQKPQITINLSPVLEAYCRFLFNTPPEQDEIIINRHCDVGKLIHSNLNSNDLPVKQRFSCSDNPVTFILSVNSTNQHALNTHFVYVSNWGQQKINDGIEYEFKAWVRRRFEMGYINKMDRKDIIEAILRGLNLRNNVANYDTIKKIDYRNRRRIQEKRFKTLLND